METVNQINQIKSKQGLGLSVPRNMGLSVPRNMRPSVPRNMGLSVPRNMRPSVPRNMGPSVPTSVGPSVPSFHGIASSFKVSNSLCLFNLCLVIKGRSVPSIYGVAR